MRKRERVRCERKIKREKDRAGIENESKKNEIYENNDERNKKMKVT